MDFDPFKKVVMFTAAAAAAATPNLHAAENYVVGAKEENESKEKSANLNMAKEAISHADQGGYISENMPGYVLVSSKIDKKEGNLHSSNYGYQVQAFAITNELVNGYKVFTIGLDGEENSSDEQLLKDLEVNGLSSSIKVEGDINETNPIGVPFAYDRLRERGMSPNEILDLFQKSNPNMTSSLLIASLTNNPDFNNYSPDEKSKILKDIEILENTQSVPEGNNQNLANNLR